MQYAHMEVLVKLFRRLHNIFPSKKIGFPAVWGVPGGFRNLREAYRIRFHLPWYPSDPVVTSYDQKTKKLTSKKVTSTSM